MPDDPFAGLGLDRTVIMPAPGGRVAPARPVPSEQVEAPDSTAVAVVSGLNPLVAAANPVLNVIAQLRASVQHPNPAALRDSLAQSIRQFEARARTAGIPTDKVIAARYALCTLVDETAASTPWGASGAWAQHGLLVLFHNETGGGEKFFQLLARLAENPQANSDLLELMYVCLELGFEGRYRVAEGGGQRELDAIRHRILTIIRKQRGEYERDLSPSWQGAQAAAQSRLGWLPVWVIAAVTLALLVGIYFAFKLHLSAASDGLASGIAAVRVAAPAPPAPPAPPRPAPEPRLAPLLADEIRRGLVAVADRPDRSVVTIFGDGLFKPGEASINTENLGLLRRVGEVLASVPGPIEVIGHTDNVPIRTLRFPSNWELSRARAESVARLLTAHVAAERVRIDGQGETDPIDANSTPQGRARNRRVDVTVYVSAKGTPAAGQTPTAVGAPPRKP
jgi:type VI secretion system protein ImpK